MSEPSRTRSAHADLPELSWAMRSDVGVVRAENEDFIGAYAPEEVEDRGPLFVVADGMGGHAAGEVASRIAVETVFEEWTAGPAAPPKQALRAGIRAANAAVFAASLDEEFRGMGTTMVALALAGSEAFVGHVGDSRAYLIRSEVCSQLTADHSRVGEMLRSRLITPEQAANHPARSMLTRSLGHDPGVQVDLGRTELEPGDCFVLCSDGLWDLVARPEIARAAAANAVDDIAGELLRTALERGAPDNVSVIVVRINSVLTPPAAAATKPWWAFMQGRG